MLCWTGAVHNRYATWAGPLGASVHALITKIVPMIMIVCARARTACTHTQLHIIYNIYCTLAANSCSHHPYKHDLIWLVVLFNISPFVLMLVCALWHYWRLNRRMRV